MSEAYRMEEESYPLDEAASEASMRSRCEKANPYFLGAFLRGEEQKEVLVGFVNGTLTKGPRLEHSTMSSHSPDGDHLCIHSVVIDRPYRRRSDNLLFSSLFQWAKGMLMHYVNLIKTGGLQKQVNRISLLSKQYLLPFYLSVSFESLGPSPVVHGQELWYECTMAIDR
jgi:hypothetical protein